MADEQTQVRELAASLGCMTREEFELLVSVEDTTADAWRRRGKGPRWIRAGNRVFYPRDAVRQWFESLVREPATVPAKEAL
jgi:hypothetical protein